ncbi:ABC transporter substrate-binding protein [Nakamurella endophytica]|uniref:Peptide ABC transporter substrate-binding protein n=1 Tax=Nakamurella endophytica TaxID=1748367 RepID=A0A917ST31_9ACTN|nr:ABC transporter substrate-binding protein [Nakamurella endophytica]GGL93597.1 peptide ABC transporter substrate-binding protein [Nakamurella endophytica]
MTLRRPRALLALLVGAAVAVSACSAGSSVAGTSSSSSSSSSSASSSSAGAGGSSAGGATSGSSGGSGSSGTSSAAPVSDASLSIGFILEPTSLDFTQADGAAIPQVMLTNVYETLVKLDQKGDIVPSLAEKYDVSADRKTYTFTLRSGVKFSNGTPMTADDVKFSFDRVTTAWKPAIKAEMGVVASTTVVSPTVVEVTLKQPSNSWLFDITGRVGAVFSKTGVADLATKPIGTGPYVFQTWNRGDSIVLQRNDAYWGQKPDVKTVTFKYFKDPSAMNSALLTGGIQVVSTEQTPETLGQFKDTSKYQIVQGATDGEVMMTMNDGKAPLSDVRVRQAINYALDKQAILQGAWSGYGTVIGSHESPNDPWFVDLANKYPHDVAKAKELLAAAGQSNLTLNLTLPPVPYATAAAPIIVSQLQEAGITVKASDVTFPVWLDQVFGKADYDLTIINHVEPRDIATLWANPQYYTRYDNKEVQQLLAAGDAGTQEQYVADYKKAVGILADDAAAAWLWSFPNLMVADANVKGLPKNLVGEAFVLSDLSVA